MSSIKKESEINVSNRISGSFSRFLEGLMRKTKLQTRYFFSYVLLALAIVGVFSAFFFQYTSNVLIERETQNIVNLTSTFQTQTDEALKTMDTVSINIGYSNLIMSNIEEYFSEETDRLSNANSLAQLFVAINGTDTRVAQINIYDFSGGVVGFGRTNVTKTLELSELDWYEPTLALNGSKFVSLPYSTDALSKATKVSVYYMSLYRTYFNRYGKQTGFIETVQNCKTVFKNVISYQKKNDYIPTVYIYDPDGTLIYPFDPTDITDTSSYSYYYDAQKEGTNNILLTNPETDSRELMAYKKSTYSGWTYITVQPEEIILAPVQTLSKLLIAFVLIMLAAASFLSFYMTRRLIKPITQLRNIIRKTELTTLGEIQGSPLHSSFDEMEELNQAFQGMSSDLKTSMNELINSKQQEMKSRSIALQSQINPHFYYNSLSSIIILAENNQAEDVVTLCRNLSNIMRYITDGSSPTVSIREELDYIEKYLYCMKVRYQSSLNYVIRVDESIMDTEIPRLIIQPLVENALKYGTNCNPPWSITIISTVCEDFWRIDVTDSGNGFTGEAIELIDSRIQTANETGGMPQISIDGMGLLNVYSRWKLYCGDDIIFSCKNTETGGGVVSIGRRISKTEQEKL